MHPIFYSFGDFSIYTWGVMLAVAVLGGVFISWKSAVKDDNDPEEAIDIAVASLLGGILGARLVWILIHFNDFGTNFIKWILINRFSGLDFWGGIFGAIILGGFVARRKKWKLLRTLDLAAVPLLFGSIWVWLGHFFNGSAYGAQTDWFVGMLAPGLVGKRHPVQLYIVFLLILALVAFKAFARKRRFAGAKVLFSLVSVGLIIFGTDYFRAERDMTLKLISFTQLEALGSVTILVVWGYWISGRNVYKDFVSILKFFRGIIVGTGNFFLSTRYRKKISKKFFRSPAKIGQRAINDSFELRSRLVWKLTHLRSKKKYRRKKKK